MSGVNKIILVGHVGRDPEIRQTESGSKVANFSLATSEKYKDARGKTIENTEWHNVVIWGKLVDVVEKWVKKGDMLYLEGKSVTRSWEKDGTTRYTTEAVCHSMQMLGGKKNDSHPLTPGDPINQTIESDYPF